MAERLKATDCNPVEKSAQVRILLRPPELRWPGMKEVGEGGK